jgi:hypothetical protein
MSLIRVSRGISKLYEDPGGSYRKVTQGMLLYESITYSENRSVIL